MELFWDKTKEKAFNTFEELESTKNTRDVSDKVYVEKLKVLLWINANRWMLK